MRHRDSEVPLALTAFKCGRGGFASAERELKELAAINPDVRVLATRESEAVR